MREIKFRGKRIDNGEWVSGWFVGYSEYSSYIYGDYIGGEVWEVLTSTVGQFTGLLDKNGKEIYEGDVIRVVNYLGEVPEELESDSDTGVVEWLDKLCYWYVSGIGHGLGTLAYAPFFPRYAYQIEIIGNRFENPELLEEATP